MVDQKFCESICEQVSSSIAGGKRSLVLWGLTEDAIEIMSRLNALGMIPSCISGIVDSSPSSVGVTIFGFPVLPPEGVRDLEIDTLIVTSNRGKEEVLRDFAQVDTRIPEVILAGTAHFEFGEPEFDQILSECLVKSYANGYENSLIHIYQSIKYLANNNIRANVAEFGIFKGGTITFIAKTLQHFGLNDAKVYGFDIFEGFPAKKTPFDLYSNPKCEFKDYNAVVDYCETMGIEVIKGDICDTYRVLEDVPLMLSFFDTDNYSPTKEALSLCYEQTVRGGILAFDHLVSEERFVYTVGERMAAREILEPLNLFNLHGTGIFLKAF